MPEGTYDVVAAIKRLEVQSKETAKVIGRHGQQLDSIDSHIQSMQTVVSANSDWLHSMQVQRVGTDGLGLFPSMVADYAFSKRIERRRIALLVALSTVGGALGSLIGGLFAAHVL